MSFISDDLMRTMYVSKWSRMLQVGRASLCLDCMQARQKRHSTTQEALCIAQRMGAYRTILTHFSARYPKVLRH